MVTSPNNLPRTVGELRATGHVERGIKQEIRENLLARLAAGDDIWPGLFGFEDTVLPQVERALIAGHDFVLLGERGQGKTRLLRSLAGLLDEWTPVITGSELGEHPYSPITPESIRRAAEVEAVGKCVSSKTFRSLRWGLSIHFGFRQRVPGAAPTTRAGPG